MRKFWAVVRFTYIEHLRSRIGVLMLIFAAFVFFSSFLFSKISGEQETRIIKDSGLAVAEICALLTALFISVRVILSEMESRTLYLVFSKPVRRYVYLTGRYFGTIAVLGSGIAVMAAAVVLLFFLKGSAPDAVFFMAVVMIFAKVSLISSVALFFSLLSTSSATALVVSFLVWVLGHGIGELEYLASGSSGWLKAVLLFITYVLPDFRLLGAKEMPDAAALSAFSSAGGLLYAAAYIVCMLFVSALIFRRKEL